MGLATRLRQVERAMGAERQGRSLWVWLVPLGSATFTFVMVISLVEPDRLALAARLPLAIIGALFMGGMSASYLAAGDVERPEKGPASPPEDAPAPYVGRPPDPGRQVAAEPEPVMTHRRR